MAADVKTAKLFTKYDGSPVIFFMRPCAERQAIRPTINEHGGKVTSNAVPGCIKLAEKGSTVTDEGYISTRFLKACVKQNKMVDINDYRIKPGTTAPGDSSDEDAESDYSLSPADYIKEKPAGLIKGRSKYTKEEDIAIMKHLIEENLYNDAQGMKIWKQMEFLKVTNHTAQSMNCRYRKQILPNIQHYAQEIPRWWISKLTGGVVPSSNTGFDVKDMFVRKSPRTKGNKEPSASTDQVSSKPVKKLYQQLEFVVLDNKQSDGEKTSSYFTKKESNKNNIEEKSTKSVYDAENIHDIPVKDIATRNKDAEKSPQKELAHRNKTLKERNEKVMNESDIDKSPTKYIIARDRTGKRNEPNIRNETKQRNDAEKAKTRVYSDVAVIIKDICKSPAKNEKITRRKERHDSEKAKTKNDTDIDKINKEINRSYSRNNTHREEASLRIEANTRKEEGKERSYPEKAKSGNDSGSECNIVSSSVEVIESNNQTSDSEEQPSSESEWQNSEDDHGFIRLKRKINKDYCLSNLKRNNLRSNTIHQKQQVSVDDKKRKRSNEIISNSIEDKALNQKKVKRLQVDEDSQGSEAQHNDSLEVNAHTIVINSQEETPDTDVIHDTPDNDDDHGIVNTKRNISWLQMMSTKKSKQEGTKPSSMKQKENHRNIDDTSIDDIINSIDDMLDAQKVTCDNDNTQQTPDSVELGDETIDTENDVGCSQESSPLLTIGPQTSTPKVNTNDGNELKELDVDDIEDCRAICKSIAERYDLQYETVRLLLYGCNGNIKRALSYINFGPHSFYPLPWSVKDDGLLEDHRNVTSLIVKYGAKDVQDRLLFLEGLL